MPRYALVILTLTLAAGARGLDRDVGRALRHAQALGGQGGQQGRALPQEQRGAPQDAVAQEGVDAHRRLMKLAEDVL